MSNKFLNAGGDTNLSNGTAVIYARNLGAENLTPSGALKTNSVNQIVSSDLEISDIVGLQTELNNVLQNPYVGTLQVSNLTTDTITNLNTDLSSLLDKTNNIESGGLNLTSTFTTTQTSFTQDQQLITKKYLDDNAGSIPTDIINVNAVKSYDYNSDLTLSTNQRNVVLKPARFGEINLLNETNVENDLLVGEENDILGYEKLWLKVDKSPSTLTQDTITGVIMNAISTILIKRIYIPSSCWTGSDTTKEIGIWNDGGILQTSYTIDKTDLQFDRYYKDINFELIKGTIYRVGVLMKSGEGQMVFSENELNDYIINSNPNGNVYGCFKTSSTLIYPSGGGNTTSLNVEFVINNNLTKYGGFNHFKGGLTIIDSILGGKKPLGYILKDDFKGNEIKGNPTEIGSVSLQNSPSAGWVEFGEFVLGSTGGIKYEKIHDMVDTTNILDINLNCRLNDWFSEGYFDLTYDDFGGITPVYLIKFNSPVGASFPKTFNVELYNGISLLQTFTFTLDLYFRTAFIDFNIKHNFSTNLFELYINSNLIGSHTCPSLTETLTSISIGGGNIATTQYSIFYLRDLSIRKKEVNENPFQFSASETGVVINDLYLGNTPIYPPPQATKSQIISTIDYSNMYPIDMLSNITAASGGVNKCWGHTAKYIANEDLLAGRVISLSDQTLGTDNSNLLKVGYMIDGSETVAGIHPIGITMTNALNGEVIEVCILGYVSAIAYNNDSAPNRGSQIMGAPTASKGKVYIDTTGGNNEGRLGFMAQSNAVVSANDPVLIYFSSFYQPY